MDARGGRSLRRKKASKVLVFQQMFHFACMHQPTFTILFLLHSLLPRSLPSAIRTWLFFKAGSCHGTGPRESDKSLCRFLWRYAGESRQRLLSPTLSHSSFFAFGRAEASEQFPKDSFLFFSFFPFSTFTSHLALCIGTIIPVYLKPCVSGLNSSLNS